MILKDYVGIMEIICSYVSDFDEIDLFLYSLGHDTYAKYKYVFTMWNQHDIEHNVNKSLIKSIDNFFTTDDIHLYKRLNVLKLSNRILDKISRFPTTLKELDLSFNYNYVLDNLPENLLILDLGCMYNIKIDMLPDKLERLIMSDAYSHGIPLLPKSLKSLIINDIYSEPLCDILPNGIEEIYLGYAYTNDTDLMNIMKKSDIQTVCVFNTYLSRYVEQNTLPMIKNVYVRKWDTYSSIVKYYYEEKKFVFYCNIHWYSDYCKITYKTDTHKILYRMDTRYTPSDKNLQSYLAQDVKIPYNPDAKIRTTKIVKDGKDIDAKYNELIKSRLIQDSEFVELYKDNKTKIKTIAIETDGHNIIRECVQPCVWCIRLRELYNSELKHIEYNDKILYSSIPTNDNDIELNKHYVGAENTYASIDPIKQYQEFGYSGLDYKIEVNTKYDELLQIIDSYILGDIQSLSYDKLLEKDDQILVNNEHDKSVQTQLIIILLEYALHYIFNLLITYL
jgi:hypothetical protein